MKADISYDLVMGDDMSFAEGTFRIHDGDWQVFIFSKGAIEQPEVTTGAWESGVKGVVVRVPLSTTLNKQVVQQMLSAHLDVTGWHEFQGPDSMALRLEFPTKNGR